LEHQNKEMKPPFYWYKTTEYQFDSLYLTEKNMSL
jgi:hypothetical protein